MSSVFCFCFFSTNPSVYYPIAFKNVVESINDEKSKDDAKHLTKQKKKKNPAISKVLNVAGKKEGP